MKNINENKPNGRRSRVIFAMHKISIINRPSSLDSPKLLLRDSSWVVNSLEGLPGQIDNEKVGALTSHINLQVKKRVIQKHTEGYLPHNQNAITSIHQSNKEKIWNFQA